MAILKTKSDSVRVRRITPALAWVFYTLEMFSRRLVEPEEIIITSVNDGKHSVNSRHYTDEAVDIRSKNFPTLAEKRWFRAALEEALGPKFRVLYEGAGTNNEHFHIQVRKGESYP